MPSTRHVDVAVNDAAVQVKIDYAAVVPGYAHMIAGYSLTTRLNVAYRGACARIRRTSDDLEVDFYVKGADLTTSRHGRGHTLEAWCSNADTRVVVWYDQSGNGAHAMQDDPLLQPFIGATRQGHALAVEDGDNSRHLVVPTQATDALIAAPESSVVTRARAPYTDVGFFFQTSNQQQQQQQLLASATGEWEWWEGRARVATTTPAAAAGFETVALTADASGTFVAYHEASGGAQVDRHEGSNDTYAQLVSSNATLRIAGELQHLYLFDTASMVGKDDEFSFRTTEGSLLASSNAYVNSESLIIKDKSSDMLSLLPTPVEGSGVASGASVTDRIRHIAGEHLWQMQRPTGSSGISSSNSGLEQEAYSNAMALTGANGDMVLWGEAFMSNAVWMSTRLTVGGDVTVGGDTRADGALHVAGSADFGSNVDISGHVTVGGDTRADGALHVAGSADFGSNVDISGHVTASNAASFFGPTRVTGSLMVHDNATTFSNVDFEFTGGSFNVGSTAHARFETGLTAITPSLSTSNAPDRADQCGVYIAASSSSAAVLGLGEGMHLEGRQDLALSINTSNIRRLLVGADGRVAVGDAAAAHAMLNVATVSNAPNLAFQDFDDPALRHVIASDHADDSLSVHLGGGDLLALRMSSSGPHGMYVPTNLTVGSNAGVRLHGADGAVVAAHLRASAFNEFVVESSNMSATLGERVEGLRVDHGVYGSAMVLGVGSNTSISTNRDLVVSASSGSSSSAIVVSASNNYVGVGLSNSVLPSYALHVSGVIYADQDMRTLSDARVKSDVRVIKGALDRVHKLTGCTFNARGGRSTGLIAQDVQRVLPEAVKEDSEGMLSLAYGNVVGLLVEAIKSMDAKVESMGAKVVALSQEVSDLKAARAYL